jgi:opacity protein-like surface antigen
MNVSFKHLALAAVLGTCAATPAFAEAPMATDDAGTLDQGGMKVETVLGRDDKAHSAELGFGYGLIENVELGLVFARATDRADDPSTKLRGTGIGIKWVPIQNDTGWSLGASFGYGHARVNERSTPAKFTEKELSLTGLASYRLENGQVLHMNLGAVRVKAQGESETLGTWGIGYEFPLMENLQLTVEAFGEEHSGPDKAIGLRYEVFDGFKISAAVGRGNDRSFGQVGFAWEF